MERKQYLTIILTLIITVALILVAFGFNLFNPDVEQNKTEIDVTSNPLLWKIEGENPSYLYGSIHLRDEVVLTLPDIVMNAIDAADVIYTEIKLDQETQNEANRLSELPYDQTLDDVLPQEIAEKLYSYLNTKGITQEALEYSGFKKYEIWAIATSLSLLDDEIKNYPNPFLDQYIWNLAVSKEKEVRGLETLYEQINVFDTLPQDEQIHLLNETLNYLDECNSNITNPTEIMQNAYLNGDLATIHDLLLSDFDENDPLDVELQSRLITNRNYNMTERICSLIENNSDKQFFFIIGAGHFYGEQGILKLLENKGYNVTRVPFNECASCDCDKDETKIKDRCYIPYEK